MFTKQSGLLGIGLKSTDYSISLSSQQVIPKSEQNFATNGITFNQGNSMACTIFSAFTLLANKFNLHFIKDYWILDKWNNDAVPNYGANAKVGWYVSSGVDYVRKWFNSQSDLVEKYGKLSTGFITVPYSWEVARDKNAERTLEIFKEILNNNNDLCGGHYGSSDYNADFKSDGILNLKKLSNPSYGHAVCISRDIKEDFDLENDIVVANSWKGVENNVYRLRYFQDLIDNGVVFPTFYAFFSEKDKIEFNRYAYKITGELADRFNGKFIQTVPTGTIFYIGGEKALNMDKYFTDFNKRDELARDLNEIGKNTGITEENFMSMIKN